VKTPVSSMLLVVTSAFIGSFGAVFLKAGASRLHRELASLLLNWRLAVGVLLYLLSSYFFVLGVREGQLTILYPLVSLGYILTFAWARLFFKEPFTPNKFIGLGMVVVGIVILQLGNH
jgi:multidrug transporter EmrE-like cation transporter